MKRRKTSKRWIESGPMATWMTLYARWLAGEPGAELTGSRQGYRARYPTAVVRAVKASFYATRPVQEDLVRLLELRQDFRDYFGRLQADTSFHAKELAREQIAANFDARRMGLERALDRQFDEKGQVTLGAKADVKMIETYTRPYLEHAFPKKVEKDERAPRIVINIQSADAKALLGRVLDEDIVDEVDYEIIPNDKLLESGDE